MRAWSSDTLQGVTITPSVWRLSMRTVASDIMAANSHDKDPLQAVMVGDRNSTEASVLISLDNEAATSPSCFRQSRMEDSMYMLSFIGFSIDIGNAIESADASCSYGLMLSSGVSVKAEEGTAVASSSCLGAIARAVAAKQSYSNQQDCVVPRHTSSPTARFWEICASIEPFRQSKILCWYSLLLKVD